MDKKYQFTIKRVEKVLEVKTQGVFTQEDGMQYIADYKANVAKIKPDEFTLEFDCSNLSLNRPEVIPILQGCLEMYKKDGFKKVVSHIGNSPDRAIVRMQFLRLAKNAGLTNVEVVE